jgi:hypothetical protein
MANIRFEIFRSRKKFNIISWLKKSKDKSYESFVSFLESKSVVSPGKEYFEKAVDLLDSINKREESFQESKELEIKIEQEVVLEKKETVPIEVEAVLPEVEEVQTGIVKAKPKARRRKSKKKTTDES